MLRGTPHGIHTKRHPPLQRTTPSHAFPLPNTTDSKRADSISSACMRNSRSQQCNAGGKTPRFGQEPTLNTCTWAEDRKNRKGMVVFFPSLPTDYDVGVQARHFFCLPLLFFPPSLLGPHRQQAGRRAQPPPGDKAAARRAPAGSTEPRYSPGQLYLHGYSI